MFWNDCLLFWWYTKKCVLYTEQEGLIFEEKAPLFVDRKPDRFLKLHFRSQLPKNNLYRN